MKKEREKRARRAAEGKPGAAAQSGAKAEAVPLPELKPGEKARITAVRAEGELGRRLTELGYFAGGKVEKVLVSPLGDPCAYRVRGTVTAIRRRDAEGILAVPEGGAGMAETAKTVISPQKRTEVSAEWD